ncbi:hypothetical protein PX860_00465 [Agrobacterium leguminum]|uniref:hypothetical protein n=1 Tax=Agrobacterium leguminum TaxID=2792015 RepID=UPI00272CF4CA|nr:hypothetical protein [Agrobacterium leguminum]WLD97002.1 hypothetical protein PX860_00465 [Agrobacterium leguminum]
MKLSITTTGKAVARSGLLPETADYLLAYTSTRAAELAALMAQCSQATDDTADDFLFLIMLAALSSPEYNGATPRRFLPYQLATYLIDGPYMRVSQLVPTTDAAAINGATLATRWISGGAMRDLEKVFEIRSGVLNSMFADVASIMRSLADTIYATTTPQPQSALPTSVDPSSLQSMLQLVGPLRRLAHRLDAGLPEEVLWVNSVKDDDGTVLNRREAMQLRAANFTSPDHILDTGRFNELRDALGARRAVTVPLAQRLQRAVRSWRLAERERLLEAQYRRLPAECRPLLKEYYRTTGVDFEHALETAMECLGIPVSAKDDGTRTSFPDLVTEKLRSNKTAIECKSKTVGDAVTFNDATDVLRKAGVNGLAAAFKVTVCQPYISPDVPRKLDLCTDLCVVNAEDLAEALVRLKLGNITMEEFASWLHRPGQALREMLPQQVFQRAGAEF